MSKFIKSTNAHEVANTLIAKNAKHRKSCMSDPKTHHKTAFDAMMNNVRKYRVLTADEETALLREAQQGNETAKETLVMSNMFAVINEAQKYAWASSLDMADLLAEGAYGLAKAIDKFDLTKGNRFATYAIHWFSKYIKEAVFSIAPTCSLPTQMQVINNKVKLAANKYTVTYGVAPSIHELVAITNENKKDIELCQRANKAVVPFVLSTDEEGGLCYSFEASYIDPSNRTDSSDDIESMRIDIDTALTILDDRARKILILNLGLNGNTPMDIADIAEMMNVSAERIRQIKRQSIDALKHNIHVKELLMKHCA